MELVPLRALIFIYGCAVLVFQLFCRLSFWSDRFWAESVDDVLYFDFIVVGGGSAGSVVAARLAEDQGHSVLLLEAGGSPRAVFDTPSVAPLLHKTDYDWQFVTVPQNDSCLGLENQASVWPRGKLLGGSGRLNFMMYVRGDPKDFDSWARQGNRGWSFNEVLPFFIKSESHSTYPSRYRGSNGPMSVDFLNFTSNLAELFLQGGRALGYETGDLNGELTSGFSITQVNGRSGQRHSTDSAFLSRKRPNLKIITHALVEKVLFNGNRAIGVQFKHKGQRKFALTNKEVVLSAGAIGSPHLLMLSGVGPKEHLQEHKIRVTKDVPGVGSNLQDHLTAGANNVILKEESAGLALTLPQMISPSAMWQYLISSSGPVSSNGCEAYALVYTSDKINRTLEPPDTQFLFFPTGHTFEGGTVIKKMSGVSDEVWEHTFAPLTGTPVASIFAVLLRPKSRGTIRLQSADPEHHPLIDPKYLTHPDDVTTFVRGLKKVVELIESQPFKSRGAMLNKIPLQGCEHFEFGSDQYWSCYIRYLSGTVYHPCGTCKMGPATDQFAVVDEELRVRGVHGLRVIDASIFPNIIGANTYAATVMVGEKGAHMIRQLWARRASSCQWTDFFIPQRKSPSDIAW